MNKNKIKELGQIFTPDHIVDMILDEVGYINENTLDKKVIEPSFGNGAFLVKILKRLLDYCKLMKMSNEEMIKQIESNIYGIEIDTNLYIETKLKLDLLLKEYGIDSKNIKWNLINQDTLNYRNYDFFDYVLGNPPYVKIHNLNEETKSLMKNFNFSNGSTDSYILFFELCINLLNKKGKLGFITPNAYMKNTSQGNFRSYLIENNLISKIIDFKNHIIFKNVSTYNSITILNKNKNNCEFVYSQHNGERTLFSSIINLKENQNLKESWCFSNKEDNDFLESIKNRKFMLEEYCNIQYGITTNKDSIYINKAIPIKNNKDNVLFNGYEIEKEILRPAVKESSYDGGEVSFSIIFPYEYNCLKQRYVPMKESELKEKYPLAYNYLLNYKKELENRSMEKNSFWYQFARSQGLKNLNHKKLVFKHIIKENKSSIEVYELPKNTIVYSGFYITLKDEYYLEDIKAILSSNDFYKYLLLVGKDLRGGYKEIRTKHLKNYKFDKIMNIK